MSRARRVARRGFTLIESIATITILAIVAGVSSIVLMGSVDGFADASTAAQLHTEASIAMDRIVRELRKIPLDASAAGVAPDVDDVTSTSIDWLTDYELTQTGSNLTLQIDGGNVSRLLSDVTTFTVAAYDESNAALTLPLTGTACDAIRRFELTLTLTRTGASTTVRTRVFVRSTMDGGGTS